MPDGTGGQSPAEDDIDRALRELTQGKAGEAKFHEPSAAERAKAAKKQAELARKQAGIRARGVRRHGVSRHGNRWPAHDQSVGWRGGARHDVPVRRRHGNGKLVAAVIVVLVLAGAAVFGWHEFGGSLASRTDSSSAGSLVAPLTQSAGPPADPFVGVAADQWADGATGIVVPAAKPTGPFSAAQVAAAYATSKKLLTAALLDKGTILGGPPTAYAQLLTAGQRSQFLTGLNARGTQKDGEPLSTRRWVVSFAPGSAELIGSVIKVHGTMTAQAVRQSGTVVLAVNVDYLVTYPIEPPGYPNDWMRIDAHQYGSFAFAPWDDPGGALEPWDQTIIGTAGNQCGSTDGYLHPDYPSLRSTPGAQGTPGPSINPYAPPTQEPSGSPACGGYANT
jgi:hypothetical protein